MPREAESGATGDPVAIRAALLRDLYFSERSRRDALRGSIGIPTAAISFAVFALGSVTTQMTPSAWDGAVGLGLVACALATTSSLLLAIYHVFMVERRFVNVDPPDLPALVEAERLIEEDVAQRGILDGQRAVGNQMQDYVTGAYAIAYEQYFTGNERSARHRTLALRFVLLAMVFVVFASVILPFQPNGATGGPPGLPGGG